jgi:hypothetical protein
LWDVVSVKTLPATPPHPFMTGLQNVGRRGPLSIFPEPGRVLAMMVALDDVEWTVLLKPQQQGVEWERRSCLIVLVTSTIDSKTF